MQAFYTLTAAFARRMIEMGFDYVVVSSDARLMAAQAKTSTGGFTFEINKEILSGCLVF